MIAYSIRNQGGHKLDCFLGQGKGFVYLEQGKMPFGHIHGTKNKIFVTS